MDRVIEYKCAYGGIEDIRKGEMPKVDLNLPIMKYFFETSHETRSKLIMPEVLGIYQIEKILPQTEYEKQNERNLDIESNIFRSIKDMRYDDILQDFGKKDNAHSDLIHIAYNPKVMSLDIVEELFKENIGRIRYSDWEKLPDFYAKRTAEIDAYDYKIRKLVGDNFEGSRHSDEDKLKKELNIKLSEQLKIYGLTRMEYVFLELTDTDKRKEILKPNKIISAFFSKSRKI